MTAESDASCNSRALYYRGGLSGRGGNWVDGRPRCGTGPDHQDQFQHLAKVRVDHRFCRLKSTKAGPGGPAHFILVLGCFPTRQGSLRDSAALRVLVRLTATLDAPTSLSTAEALEKSTFARDPRAKHRLFMVMSGCRRHDRMAIQLGLFELMLFRIFLRRPR